VGITWSKPVDVGGTDLLMLGDSLLTRALIALFGPELGPGQELAAHPVMLAAWAGFLVTAMNLLPVSQLDGGHVLYAVTPRGAHVWMHRFHAMIVVLGLIGVVVQGSTGIAALLAWLGRADLGDALVTAMRPLLPYFTHGLLVLALLTRVIGVEHPPAREADVPLTPARKKIALACLVIWALTVVPNPMWIEPAKPAPAASEGAAR
ncbi:site-2 protease family protein, partial [Myxococcota bacterium]|nr:site-2 protease family protein [Myxococcota bacterium]